MALFETLDFSEAETELLLFREKVFWSQTRKTKCSSSVCLFSTIEAAESLQKLLEIEPGNLAAQETHSRSSLHKPRPKQSKDVP